MIEYMSAPQTKGKRCFKDFAGTYFSLLGSVNDTTGGTLLSGAYRTLQLYSDGRAYGCQTAEILTNQALGNIVGHWTCNETSSDSTHIAIRRIHLFYDTNGRPLLRTVAQDLTCNNTLKSCVGQTVDYSYNSQLPDQGQFRNPFDPLRIYPDLYFYANFPPY